MNNVPGIAAQSPKEGSVSVHDNETKFLIRFQELTQGFGVELVVAKIKRCIDGLERFEVDVDPPLFAFGGYDFTAIDDQAVRRDLGVKLQSLLGRGDGGEDRQAIDSRLDVGSGALVPSVIMIFSEVGSWTHEFFSQHFCRSRDLILRGCSISSSALRQADVHDQQRLTDDERNH